MPTHCCSPLACVWLRRSGRLLQILSAFAVLSTALAFADEPAAEGSPEWSARVNSGGIGRYVTGRWGMAKALASNSGTTTQAGLVIVTPPGSQGLQYAKKFSVPAGASF